MSTYEKHHTSASGEPIKPESHRVLIVDDEPAIRFAYSKLLERELFYYDVCESIEDATTYLSTKDYFAVISDVRFAGSDNEEGVHFVSTVRTVQPLSEVILVTGYGGDELEQKVRTLGASHYFEKPITPSLILSLLRELHQIADEREENEFFNSLLLNDL